MKRRVTDMLPRPDLYATLGVFIFVLFILY